MNQPALDLPLTTLAENYIVKRLKDHGAFIYPVSDQFPLKERIRRAIKDNKLDMIVVGRNAATKKCETYEQLFSRTFNEPLTTTTKPTKRATA